MDIVSRFYAVVNPISIVLDKIYANFLVHIDEDFQVSGLVQGIGRQQPGIDQQYAVFFLRTGSMRMTKKDELRIELASRFGKLPQPVFHLIGVAMGDKGAYAV